MKLQNFFIKSKIKELTKKHPSIWTNSNVYQLFFYFNNKEFEKYKKILVILYNEFLIEIENNNRSKELTFDLENLKEMKIYLQQEEEIDLRNKLDEFEKNKIEELQKDKINTPLDINSNEDINDNVCNDNVCNDNVCNDNNIKANISSQNKNSKPEKKYINNLHDAELFTIDEIIKVSDIKYYLEIFFGLGLVIFIFIIKGIYNVSNKFIESDFYKLKVLNKNNILNDTKILNEKFLNSKLFESLYGNDIKIELKDLI
jgi:hypothetical protein